MLNKIISIFFVLIILISIFISATGKVIEKEETEDIIGKNYALIIEGTAVDLDFQPFDNKDIQKSFKKSCDTAQLVFSRLDYHPPKRLTKPNTNKVKDIITNEIPEKLGDKKQVFIFIAAHGDAAGNLLMKWLQFDPMISSSELNNWLNTMESKCNPSRVTVVIESCHSGHHAVRLSGSNRIIITSTDLSNAWIDKTEQGDYQSFSYSFFSSLLRGKSYGEAFTDADRLIDGGNWLSSSQNPQINDNGDSISSGTSKVDYLPINLDGKKALKTWPGKVKDLSKEKNITKSLFYEKIFTIFYRIKELAKFY